MKKHTIRLCRTLSRAARNRVRTSSFALLLVLGLLVLLPGSVSAADGDLDTTFGDPQVNGDVYALALQSDGKVLIAGDFTQVGTTSMNYVARLNANGTLDTSFGNPQVDQSVYALALQSDGKVLIGGIFVWVGTTMMRRVARLNTDGTRDTSFGDPQVTYQNFNTPLVYTLTLIAS
ncbi:MAG: delta-60 repeat domain-containing protein [Anaerolineae bacterium]|nr:delta-60 repeat domain-containing protein [Anaerolineae bacterium]